MTAHVDLIREAIALARWRQSVSPRFKNAPHSYLLRDRDPEFGILAAWVQHTATPRRWHGFTYHYSILDGWCYWVTGDELNRADAATLEIE